MARACKEWFARREECFHGEWGTGSKVQYYSTVQYSTVQYSKENIEYVPALRIPIGVQRPKLCDFVL